MEDTKSKEAKEKEEPVQIIHDFKCSSCGLDEKAHYKGTQPPFSRNLLLKYPSYVMKDPFNPPGKGEVLVLGGDCSQCDKPVCISKECSLFYSKMFCLDCAQKCIEMFPIEMKVKIAQIKKKC